MIYRVLLGPVECPPHRPWRELYGAVQATPRMARGIANVSGLRTRPAAPPSCITCRQAKANGTTSSIAWCHSSARTGRATPLVSDRVIVDLISATTIKTGLTVRCELDPNTSPKELTVTAAEMQALNIIRADFHGENGGQPTTSPS